MHRVLPSAIPFEDEQRDVMAWVGFALLWAQALERTMAAYLTFAWPGNVVATPLEFRAFARQVQDKTAGRLIKDLRKCRLPDDETVMLRSLNRVVNRRDRLAHHFLRHPSDRDQLRTSAGRESLIREARRDADDFRISANHVALIAFEHAVRLNERTQLLRTHSDWIGATQEDIKRRGGRQAFDPTLATEIGELVEAIQLRRSSDSGLLASVPERSS
jgi:hypothetical protein